jgi:fermentation-respiration switch protein FrsA (DUF1100 family)
MVMMLLTLRFLALLCIAFLLSCTTIDIREADAFAGKKTVDAADMRQRGMPLREFYLAVNDSVNLRVWHLENPAAGATVLYFGGNGFFLAISGDILSAIYDQGVSVLAFDYRGYGKSTGTPSVAGILEDANTVYQYLRRDQALTAEQIIIHGHSMGSALALWLANRQPVAAVVLESPLTDAEDVMGRLVPTLLKPFIRVQIDSSLLEVSNLREIERLQQPLLIIGGEKDQITPPEMAELLYGKAPVSDKDILLLPTGDHNNLPLLNAYRQKLSQFYSLNGPEAAGD